MPKYLLLKHYRGSPDATPVTTGGPHPAGELFAGARELLQREQRGAKTGVVEVRGAIRHEPRPPRSTRSRVSTGSCRVSI